MSVILNDEGGVCVKELIVNGEHVVIGKLTVEQKIVPTEDEAIPFDVEIRGCLITDTYIEDLLEVKSDKFDVLGVEVFGETMDSETELFSFYFVAEEIVLADEVRTI